MLLGTETGFAKATLQVCLDGQGPSFAYAKRQTLPATNARSVGQALRANHTDQTKDGTRLRTVFYLVRMSGLEPT